MAFTSTDKANIESAILALARGQRAATVRFSDGEQVTYTETDLNSLQNLLGRIKREIARAGGKKPFRYVVTSKGY